LFTEEEIETSKSVLFAMWKQRENKLKELENYLKLKKQKNIRRCWYKGYTSEQHDGLR